jgi:hypothetical protein
MSPVKTVNPPDSTKTAILDLSLMRISRGVIGIIWWIALLTPMARLVNRRVKALQMEMEKEKLLRKELYRVTFPSAMRVTLVQR